MICISYPEVYGFQAAVRGMRNPKESWKKSDSVFEHDGKFQIGTNDLRLMKNLTKAGTDHSKFLRTIVVAADILAPLYWWKEYDTYKVGTVANSCSTMHRIHAKEFKLYDFAHEKLTPENKKLLQSVVDALNKERKRFLETKDKEAWWQMIQLLPSSYYQRRTIHLNYAVLLNMYKSRKNHKLDEWKKFCIWVESLPYFKQICLED